MFISTRTLDVDGRRRWWIEHQKDFSTLSRMAFDLISAAVTITLILSLVTTQSDQVERVSSSIGLTIKDHRIRLKDDIIEAIACQKSWEDAGILQFEEIQQIEQVLRGSEDKGRYS